jgi:type II secretory pathway predicted ATPase ExeA
MHVATKAENLSSLYPPPEASSLGPFDEDTSGFDYLHSELHHRHLVTNIVGHLARGAKVLLVIGVGSADGDLIARLLDETSAKRYRAGLVSARPGIEVGELLDAYGNSLGIAAHGEGKRRRTLLWHLAPQARRGLVPVLIVARAEALDPQCFDELLRFTQVKAPSSMPIVLLASQRFAAQLDGSARNAISAIIAFERLAHEEVASFLDHQSHRLSDNLKALFTPETAETIAAAAQGDPVMVNRLARGILFSADAGGGEASVPTPAANPSVADAAPVTPMSVAAAASEDLGEMEIPGAAEAAPDETVAESAEPILATPPPAEVRGGRRLAMRAAAIGLSGAALVGVFLFPSSAPETRHEIAAATIALPLETAAEATPTDMPAWPSDDDPAEGPPPVPPLPAWSEKAGGPVAAPRDSEAATPPSPVEPASSPGIALLPAVGSTAATIATPSDPSRREAGARATSATEEAPPLGEPSARVEARLAPETPAAPSVAAAMPEPAPSPVATAASQNAARSAVAPSVLSVATAAPPAPPAAPAVAAFPAPLPPREPAPAAPSGASLPALPREAALPPAAAARAAPSEPAPQAADARLAAGPPWTMADVGAKAAPPPVAAQPPAAPPTATAALEPPRAASPHGAPPPAARPDAAPQSTPTVDPEVTLMLKRGDQLLAAGDVVSARRFFERAAGGGSSEAMCGVGKTFDPLFLRRLGVLGIAGNAQTAIAWYRKASDAGSVEGAARLNLLIAAHPQK